MKQQSATSRLRVVFNASSPTSNATSLNDHLMVGPKLQAGIATVLLQWRSYRLVYCLDMSKMFRQIRVDDRDDHFQRILWRDSPADPVVDYQLRTVTYGTACAPHLAHRVLQQLVADEDPRFPLASGIIQPHVYVDDCLFGTSDMRQAKETRRELVAMLNSAGFRLRKWASNSVELLSDVDPADHGLAHDKSFETWLAFRDQLRFLDLVTIPKWTGQGLDVRSVSVHGFADASNAAYAAVSESSSACCQLLSCVRRHCVIAGCHCWSDASIVLHWLDQHASYWKTVVANRVAVIPAVAWPISLLAG